MIGAGSWYLLGVDFLEPLQQKYQASQAKNAITSKFAKAKSQYMYHLVSQ
jgi:hypothetical protein